MRRPFLIAGNWKMYKTIPEGRGFVEELEKSALLDAPGLEVVLFPPFTALASLRAAAKRVRLGAQNLYCEKEGAYTGEISATMLKGLADWVLVGHSERRTIFKESDDLVNRKVRAALSAGLKVVFCLGETLDEREKGRAETRMAEQLRLGLGGLSAAEVGGLVFAYEPVWAIGTGRNATPEQAQSAHRFIVESIAASFPGGVRPAILYGGSVKPENSFELLSQPDVDGLLIGGASLKVESFSAIIASAVRLRQQ